MSWIRVLFFNVLVTLALIGGILLAPPILYGVYKFYKQSDVAAPDVRSTFKLYDNYPWAKDHFSEFSHLSTTYYDYITWRRDDFSGKTINIHGGLRKTSIPAEIDKKRDQFWFFGGSTTWGTGVSDAYTYPSLFAEKMSLKAINFGETGYISRQSLSLLENQLIREDRVSSLKGIHVVFYDGVNDVESHCRAEAEGFGTVRQAQIRKLLADRWSYERTFGQIVTFVQNFLRSTHSLPEAVAQKAFTCAMDSVRAREVATNLVNTWEAAAALVTARGGKFTAILQPVSFIGSPQLDYLKQGDSFSKVLGEQYVVVYPLVREIASKRGFRFFDMTGVYDGCDFCYVDHYHVGPDAHKLLVTPMSDLLMD